MCLDACCLSVVSSSPTLDHFQPSPRVQCLIPPANHCSPLADFMFHLALLALASPSTLLLPMLPWSPDLLLGLVYPCFRAIDSRNSAQYGSLATLVTCVMPPASRSATPRSSGHLPAYVTPVQMSIGPAHRPSLIIQHFLFSICSQHLHRAYYSISFVFLWLVIQSPSLGPQILGSERSFAC